MPVGPSILCPLQATRSAPSERHVDGHVRDRLARVDDAERTDRVRTLHDLGDRVDRAEDVRLVHDRHDARRVVDERVELAEVEPPVVGQADPAQRRPGLRADLLPRHEVRVMLHLRDHDRVPGPQHEARVDGVRRERRLGRRVGEGVGAEVQALGGVLREHEVRRPRRRRSRRSRRATTRRPPWPPPPAGAHRGARPRCSSRRTRARRRGPPWASGSSPHCRGRRADARCAPCAAGSGSPSGSWRRRGRVTTGRPRTPVP